MARVLFTSWPFPGHIYPLIAIAHALRERGHECAFYTGARSQGVVRDEGFRCFPYAALDEEAVYRVMFRARRGTTRLGELRALSVTLRHWLLDSVPGQVADLEGILREWAPDVIATDPTFWGPVLVLRERFGATVALASFVPACMIPGRDAPVFGPGLPPPRSAATRLLARVAGAATRLAGTSFRRAASDVRARYGLPPIRESVTELTATLPLYLVPASREFDYDREDVPPSVAYVGPYLWNRPRRDDAAGWLETIPRDRPWVHVSEGTLHVDEPFLLRMAASALADRPVRVVMTTGGDRQPGELGLGTLAPNVHVAPWVSHADLLPRTALVVTTGGAGSVLASLSAGVPLVILPTEWDKPEIARRVVACGAGLQIDPRRATPARLQAAVDRVLGDPRFAAAARRIAASFAPLGGADRAARLLESLAARGPAPRAGLPDAAAV